jgi:hypothetical protein
MSRVIQEPDASGRAVWGAWRVSPGLISATRVIQLGDAFY